MTGYLLDTNVLSEIIKGAPDQVVAAFLDRHEDLWLPAIVIYELEYGARIMPQGQRRRSLEVEIARLLRQYTDRIITLDRPSAEWAAEFSTQTYRAGRSTERRTDLADALIAGMAKAHDMVLVTRNTRDFELFDVEVINPWESP